jgi:hypothetical protein
MNFNSDFKYDLEVGQVAERELAELLGKKIEVKNDQKAHITGNVFIEYESRGKRSGIAISESDYYCIVVKQRYVIIKKDELKDMCRKYLNTNRDVLGGDNNTSKGILLPITDLIGWK